MTITLPGLILLIAVAPVCGAIGRPIAGEGRGGPRADDHCQRVLLRGEVGGPRQLEGGLLAA